VLARVQRTEARGSGEPPIPFGVPASLGNLRIGRRRRRLDDADNAPNGGPGPHGLGRHGSGSVPEAPAAEIRSSPLACQNAKTPGTWLARSSVDRIDAAGDEGADGGGFGPRNRHRDGALPAGVSAPEGGACPRARRAAGRCGDGRIASKRSASWSSEHGTGSQRARRVRWLATVGKPHRKAGAEQKPHEWQRSSRPQRGRGANRRGSEKLRGRNVPGEASPGGADPVTDVAEGAPEPHEGNRRPRGLWSAVRLVP
jgi:hypothetical protein